MPQVTKIARFYEATRIDQNDKVVMIKGDFWAKLLDKLEKQTYHKRVHNYSGTDYYGEAKLGVKPALRYLYAGRLRDKGDWPDTFDSGVVGDLTLRGLLVEPTYVVPFGNKNYCAVLTPRFSGIVMSALESWLTAASNLTTTGDRIELRPVLDKGVLTKLNQRAVGATRLSVRIPRGASVPDGTGGGEVGDAVRAATADTTAELSAELTWSFGHSKGSEGWRGKLLEGAKWIAGQNWADKAQVSMLIPETDGNDQTVRSETHDLIRDRITYSVKLDVPSGEKPSELSVLTAIQSAIDRYRRENS